MHVCTKCFRVCPGEHPKTCDQCDFSHCCKGCDCGAYEENHPPKNDKETNAARRLSVSMALSHQRAAKEQNDLYVDGEERYT